MNSFARCVSGIASVGLNAIEFVTETIDVVDERRPQLARRELRVLVLRELEVGLLARLVASARFTGPSLSSSQKTSAERDARW